MFVSSILFHKIWILIYYNEWNLAVTIDKELGFVGRFSFHNIIETHVLYHYVSRI